MIDRARRRVGKGIYADKYGLAATVKVRGQQREKRFPRDTSIKTIKNWQGDTKAALRKLRPKIGRGTLAADVERYLAGRTQMPTYDERVAHLALWCTEFGPRNRHTIETLEIDTVLSRWLDAGLRPSTVRNRRTALQALWTGLDGKAAPNPVREALMPVLAEPEARAVPYTTIHKILAAMPDVGQGKAGESRDDQSKTKARLAVIAYTGLPHALVKKLTPEAIDWRAKTVAVPARKKGKGAAGRILPLTAEGLKALRQFADLECWGTFSNSSMIKSFRRACSAAKVVPAPRVYDLRHSFATEMYRQTGDPKATAELLMHSPSSQMMDRYTIGGVSARLKLAVGAFDAAMPAGKSRAKRLAVTAGRNRQRRKTA
jgi:integrase